MSLYDRSGTFNSSNRYNSNNFDIKRNIYNKGLNYDERIRRTLKLNQGPGSVNMSKNVTRNSFKPTRDHNRQIKQKVNVFQSENYIKNRVVKSNIDNVVPGRNSMNFPLARQLTKTNTYEFDSNTETIQNNYMNGSHSRKSHKQRLSSNPMKKIPIFNKGPVQTHNSRIESKKDGSSTIYNNESLSNARGTSPLRMNINNRLKSRDSSVKSNVNSFKHLSKEDKLQRTLKMREAEIQSLNKELNHLKQNQSLNTSNKSAIIHQIKSLQNDLNSVKIDKEFLEAENKRLKAKIQQQQNEFSKKLFDIKLEYEKNTRENMEVVERELVFKYANDDNESIRMLKQQINELRSGYR